MKKLILIMCVCVMALSGCGCTNADTNNDGIVGNDNPETNADKGEKDDTLIEDKGETIGSDASRMVRDAGNGIGRATDDILDGAGNVVRDAGNAAGNMIG